MALGAIASRFIGDQRAAHIYNLKRNFVNRARFLVRSRYSRSGPVLTDRPYTLLSKRRHHAFFGYYDVSPLGDDDTKSLAVLVPGGNKSPSADTVARVGYFDLTGDERQFVELGTTTLWCWQQSCRLQWHPSDGPNADHILYNTLTPHGGQCVIQHLRTRGVVKEFSRPVYATSSDGRYGFSLDFARLHRLRPGYGYAPLDEYTPNEKCPSDNGIWRVDLKTSRETLLFSIADIAAMSPLPSMEVAEHYFNHILVNPSGTRFLFIHLWARGKQKSSRMITADLDGSARHLVINSGHASHYYWDGNDRIICYSTLPGRGTHIFRYTDQSDAAEVLLAEQVKRDCHMSLAPDGNTLLLDSYPDEHRLQALALCDLRTQNRTDIASFYAPSNYSGEVRCDLHPRFNADGSKVCVDTVYRGKRALCILNIGAAVHDKQHKADQI